MTDKKWQWEDQDAAGVNSDHKPDWYEHEKLRVPGHIHCMLPAPEVLTMEQLHEVVDLLVEYVDIFIGADGKVAFMPLVTHTIDTGNNLPVNLPWQMEVLV